MSWKTIKLGDLAPGVQKVGVHKMSESLLHWKFCAHCGLLGLKNEETRKSLKKPCVYEE